jgi:hypothetical protein
MLELDQAEHLPRLFELDAPPPHASQRWCWRRLLRWREYIFQVWQHDSRSNANALDIE